jgi:hypothetical protein
VKETSRHRTLLEGAGVSVKMDAGVEQANRRGRHQEVGDGSDEEFRSFQGVYACLVMHKMILMLQPDKRSHRHQESRHDCSGYRAQEVAVWSVNHLRLFSNAYSSRFSPA